MKVDGYKPRVLDEILVRKLRGIGAVLIEGPKLCGKTTTAENVAKSVIYMSDPNVWEKTKTTVDWPASHYLKGRTPRLIDEWQLMPKIWDAVRFEVDHRRKKGLFILTGSAVPADRSDIFHSGTGRFAWLRMRPMSLFESEDSNGKVSLDDLFAGRFEPCKNSLSYSRVAYLACRGGWPAIFGMDEKDALGLVFNYFDAVVNEDISRVDGVRRNATHAKKLLKSYARNQGSQISISGIQADMQASDVAADVTMSIKTTAGYLDALREIFVIEDMPAWNPNLRSKAAIRTAETRYFSDPSFCAAALDIGPKDLENNPETFGFVFETLCMRDLRTYADALDGSVYHYRDSNDLECDAVLHRRGGTYGLIEIKLGGDSAVEHGAHTLKKLASKIDDERMSKPSFLMVLTAVGEWAYQRTDGVYVVPIGCLRP